MTSEASIQQRTMLLMAQLGGCPWRNNVGVAVDDYGRHIRYGLANSSAQENKVIKSSDIIGPMPVLITQAHVGRVMGIFTALEIKEPGWHMTPGDKRALAQAKFHDIVKSVGGFAGFITEPNDIYGIIK